MTIAMSASVTVSIAEERTGMLSEISPVTRVLVSAWLGRTEDSAGFRRTSSKVSPRGISICRLSLLISAPPLIDGGIGQSTGQIDQQVRVLGCSVEPQFAGHFVIRLMVASLQEAAEDVH